MGLRWMLTQFFSSLFHVTLPFLPSFSPSDSSLIPFTVAEKSQYIVTGAWINHADFAKVLVTRLQYKYISLGMPIWNNTLKIWQQSINCIVFKNTLIKEIMKYLLYRLSLSIFPLLLFFFPVLSRIKVVCTTTAQIHFLFVDVKDRAR